MIVYEQLYEGLKLKRVLPPHRDKDYSWWTTGGVYTVLLDGDTFILKADDGDTYQIKDTFGSMSWLNDGFRIKRGQELKDTNPKDAVGISKPPRSTVSAPVLAEVGVAMLEGALKYGRHNYRVAGVRASVYYDAAVRHLDQWWEGEDIDPDSGVHHIAKAIASLAVLRDSMIQGNINDDRPPRSPEGWLRDLEPLVKELMEKYPNPKEAHTHG